jgi:hypothetical protein
MARSEPQPVERTRTLRQAILVELARGPMDARELSAALGLRERDVIPHLEHLALSLKRGPQRLVVEPAQCIACDYVFVDRRRLGKPGSCPRCRAQRIEPPRFSVEER